MFIDGLSQNYISMLDSHIIVAHYKLACGDRIIRSKSIFPEHRAIYVGVHQGIPLVAENPMGNGVQYIPLDEFLLWGVATIDRIERFVGTEEERREVIPRLNKLTRHQVKEKANTAGAALWGMSLLAMLGGLLIAAND